VSIWWLLGVPLVDGEDACFAGVVRQLHDPLIAIGEAFAAVHYDKSTICTVDCFLGTIHHVILDRPLDFSAPSNSRRIDESKFLALVLQLGVNRIPSRSGDAGDDHSLLTGKGVDQRGLTDVGAAYDRNPNLLTFVSLLRTGREKLHNHIHQISDSASMEPGNRVDLSQAKTVELICKVVALRIVCLVDDDEHRFFDRTQLVSQILIIWIHARQGVGHKKYDIRFFERNVRLDPYLIGKGILLLKDDASGVDYLKSPTVPIGFRIQTIARDSRGIFNDSDPSPDKPVKNCAFSNVGTANDHDNGQRRTHRGLGQTVPDLAGSGFRRDQSSRNSFMKVFGVILFILIHSALAFGDTGDPRTTSSHYMTGFIGQGQLIFGSQDVPFVYGVSYGYGRPEPRFQWGEIPAQVVYEVYIDHAQNSGASSIDPNSTFAVGALASSRWRWPLDRQGNGIYFELGWGLQLSDHPTLDLDSQLNSTPITGVGGSFKVGPREFLIGLRYLHISNADLKGHNLGENELLLMVGFRY